MLSVTIKINGRPIVTRTAVRKKDATAHNRFAIYETDTGEMIQHNPKAGAIALAQKLLETATEED